MQSKMRRLEAAMGAAADVVAPKGSRWRCETRVSGHKGTEGTVVGHTSRGEVRLRMDARVSRAHEEQRLKLPVVELAKFWRRLH